MHLKRTMLKMTNIIRCFRYSPTAENYMSPLCHPLNRPMILDVRKRKKEKMKLMKYMRFCFNLFLIPKLQQSSNYRSMRMIIAILIFFIFFGMYSILYRAPLCSLKPGPPEPLHGPGQWHGEKGGIPGIVKRCSHQRVGVYSRCIPATYFCPDFESRWM